MERHKSAIKGQNCQHKFHSYWSGGRNRGGRVEEEGGGEEKRDLITSGCFDSPGGCHGNISMKLSGIKKQYTCYFNCLLKLSNVAERTTYENTQDGFAWTSSLAEMFSGEMLPFLTHMSPKTPPGLASSALQYGGVGGMGDGTTLRMNPKVSKCLQTEMMCDPCMKSKKTGPRLKICMYFEHAGKVFQRTLTYVLKNIYLYIDFSLRSAGRNNLHI